MLKVEVNLLKTTLVYGESLQLHCEAENSGIEDVYIVVDNPLYPALKSANELFIRLGIPKVPDHLYYYAFKIPKLRRLGSSDRHNFTVRIGLPLQETVIGTDGLAHFREIRVEGLVVVTLELGYGNNAFRPVSSDGLGDFLDWQKIANSNTTTVQLAPP